MNPLPGRNQETASHAHDGEESTLLERMSAGDATAFARFLDASWQPLVHYCARMVGNLDVAQDIGQEALIRFWEHRLEWKAGSSARAILYTIARNLALNERQSLEGRRRLLGETWSTASGGPTPDEWLQARDLASAMDRAVSQLPARQQEVLQLSRINGLSRSEIAAITGLSEQTIANHLVAALKNLRKILGPLLRDS